MRVAAVTDHEPPQPTPPGPPSPAVPLAPPELRGVGQALPISRPALRQFSGILVAYGIVGLAVAALGMAALFVGLGRVNGLGEQLRDDVGGVTATLERTASVLDDAAASARSFGTTIDTSTTALGSAATDLRAIVPQLRTIESQAGAINILGTNPFGQIAGLFGQIAGQLGDLDTQLDGIATNLGANRSALDANAASLAALATETRTLRDRLGGDAVPGAVDDLRWLLMALLGVATLGAAVPAVGALLVGIWLRRTYRLDPPPVEIV